MKKIVSDQQYLQSSDLVEINTSAKQIQKRTLQ